MRVMGIDPGLTRCGVGVVETFGQRKVQFVAAGVVRTPRELDTGRRLLQLEEELTAWFDEYKPEAIAVERVFAQHNLMSVTDTAQAAGVALLLGARRGVTTSSYTPSEVKAGLTGSGRADKAQVGYMVTKVLRLEEAPRPADAADAVALAICHVWRGGGVNRYAQAVAQARGQR